MKRWQRDLLKTLDRLVHVLELLAIQMERYNDRQERDDG